MKNPNMSKEDKQMQEVLNRINAINKICTAKKRVYNAAKESVESVVEMTALIETEAHRRIDAGEYDNWSKNFIGEAAMHAMRKNAEFKDEVMSAIVSVVSNDVMKEVTRVEDDTDEDLSHIDEEAMNDPKPMDDEMCEGCEMNCDGECLAMQDELDSDIEASPDQKISDVLVSLAHSNAMEQNHVDPMAILLCYNDLCEQGWYDPAAEYAEVQAVMLIYMKLLGSDLQNVTLEVSANALVSLFEMGDAVAEFLMAD